MPSGHTNTCNKLDIMKKTSLILALALPLLAACGNKSEQASGTSIDTTTTAEPATSPTPEGADAPWSYQTEQHVGGHKYNIDIRREADSELPTVTDDAGNPCLDNHVQIDIRRDDAPMFSRRFTKEAFLDFLTADDRKQCVLQGIAFDRIEGENVLFGAQLGKPGSDSGPIFIVTITPAGVVDITKDYTQDTTGV